VRLTQITRTKTACGCRVSGDSMPSRVGRGSREGGELQDLVDDLNPGAHLGGGGGSTKGRVGKFQTAGACRTCTNRWADIPGSRFTPTNSPPPLPPPDQKPMPNERKGGRPQEGPNQGNHHPPGGVSVPVSTSAVGGLRNVNGKSSSGAIMKRIQSEKISIFCLTNQNFYLARKKAWLCVG